MLETRCERSACVEESFSITKLTFRWQISILKIVILILRRKLTTSLHVIATSTTVDIISLLLISDLQPDLCAGNALLS